MEEVQGYELVLVPAPKGMTGSCLSCQKVLVDGTWAVGLIVGGRNYLVGHNPPLTCCDAERPMPMVFDSQDEAQAAVNEVRATLQEDGTAENLKLLEGAQILSTAVH